MSGPPTPLELVDRRTRAVTAALARHYEPRHAMPRRTARGGATGRGAIAGLVLSAVLLATAADHAPEARQAGAASQTSESRLDDAAVPADTRPSPTPLASVEPQPAPLPVAAAPAPPSAQAPNRASRSWARPAQVPVRPVPGATTSVYGPRWGRQHGGIDLRAGTGTPVVAAASGTVVSAGWAGGYGRLITLRHEDGTVTAYAHLSRLDVRAGQAVERGERLGASGATGNVTGPHLHFEVRTASGKRDPEQWLREPLAS